MVGSANGTRSWKSGVPRVLAATITLTPAPYVQVDNTLTYGAGGRCRDCLRGARDTITIMTLIASEHGTLKAVAELLESRSNRVTG